MNANSEKGPGTISRVESAATSAGAPRLMAFAVCLFSVELGACGGDLSSLKHPVVFLFEDSLEIEERESAGSGRVNVVLGSLEGTFDGVAMTVKSTGHVTSRTTCSGILGICTTMDDYTHPTLVLPKALSDDLGPHTIELKAGARKWVIVTPDFSVNQVLTGPHIPELHANDHVMVDCGCAGTISEVSLMLPNYFPPDPPDSGVVSDPRLWLGFVTNNRTPGPVAFDVSLDGVSNLSSNSGKSLPGVLKSQMSFALSKCEGPERCVGGGVRRAESNVTLVVP